MIGIEHNLGMAFVMQPIGTAHYCPEGLATGRIGCAIGQRSSLPKLATYPGV
jgi:hypothetical protein